MDMNNKVVRVNTVEQGEKVLAYFKHKGVKIGNRTVECWGENGDKGIYYGVIKGIFDNYRRESLTEFVEIIHLSEEMLLPIDKLKTVNPLLEDMEATFEKCLGIAKRKNADYGGSIIDPYKNFMGSLLVGVDPERAILVRITDKLSRVGTLLSQEAQVKDESIEDTIDDAINYFAILKSYIKREVK